MTWLVLCSATDAPALWAFHGLRARGLAPLELVTAEALAAAPRWEHRVGNGGTSVRATLPDGRILDGAAVRGTLNRLLAVPSGLFAASGDGAYANQEMQAFFLSWLHSLHAPVLNPPTPQGLCGRWRHASEWALLAAQAGLHVPALRQSSREEAPLPPVPDRTVIVLGSTTTGAPAPPSVRAACLRLAQASGTPLLGVELAAGQAGSWIFTGATPFPDLRLGGEPLLDRLATALRRSA